MVTSIYIPKEEIEATREKMRERYEKAKTVPGTKASIILYHCRLHHKFPLLIQNLITRICVIDFHQNVQMVVVNKCCQETRYVLLFVENFLDFKYLSKN